MCTSGLHLGLEILFRFILRASNFGLQPSLHPKWKFLLTKVNFLAHWEFNSYCTIYIYRYIYGYFITFRKHLESIRFYQYFLFCLLLFFSNIFVKVDHIPYKKVTIPKLSFEELCCRAINCHLSARNHLCGKLFLYCNKVCIRWERIRIFGIYSKNLF